MHLLSKLRKPQWCTALLSRSAFPWVSSFPPQCPGRNHTLHFIIMVYSSRPLTASGWSLLWLWHFGELSHSLCLCDTFPWLHWAYRLVKCPQYLGSECMRTGDFPVDDNMGHLLAVAPSGFLLMKMRSLVPSSTGYVCSPSSPHAQGQRKWHQPPLGGSKPFQTCVKLHYE